MTILALEFSSPQRSVAVRHEASAGAPLPVVSEVVETGAVSTQGFEMIEAALRQAQLEREQIECLAIGLGPGSYTGIRAAIAVAQGWQLARDIKLAGVSSAEAIAAQAHADGLRGLVGVVIDAQRHEFYLAEYELSAEKWVEVAPLRIVPAADVQARASTLAALLGPEVTRWFPNGRLVFPRAAVLAQMAAARGEFVPGEKLEPIYLRETKFVKAPKPREIP